MNNESKKRSRLVSIIVIGLTMFATQFGAGNLIFPPYLGRNTGTSWPIGFVAFAVMDIGIAAAAILSVVVNRNGDVDGVLGKIGKVPGKVMLTLVILCIGPGLAIPRTAATSFEMGINRILPGLPLWVFGLAFFTVVLVCVIKPSRVVDIIGNYLTPVLLTVMLILIILGIVHPLGKAVDVEGIVPFKEGIINGYQTMDGLGGVLTAMIGITAAASYNYTSKEDQLKILGGAMPIAQALLIIVYGGLTILGSTVSGVNEYLDLDQAPLIIKITGALMGDIGVYALAVIVLLACLTTSIGLTMVAGNHFAELSGGRVSYKTVVLIVIGVSYALTNFGLSKIISIAVPILSTLYPPMIVLVVMAFFDRKVSNDKIAATGAYFAFAYALCETLNSFGIPLGFISVFPMAEVGLGWIGPAVIGCITGEVLSKKLGKS